MMTAGLTARQAQALLFIAGAIETCGLSPTLDDMLAADQAQRLEG